ncbi:hypothetical protein D1007_18586 [Hordeum vulgare]|nr:hypothetical protein D1007_18586 [Hordeum vulgare]
MSLFQEGTEEYNWWTGVPSANAQGSAGIKVPVYDVTPIAIAPFSGGAVVGSPRPQEELVVLLSNREPSPDRDEEKARLKEEKKVKSKKGAGNPISGGAKYKKIKTDDKTEAMYQYFSMKSFNFVFTQKVFNPSVCGKELRRLFFSVYPDGHWIFCVINLLHKQFNLFDSINNGNLDVAARNLRVVAKELDFTMDLNSFKENKTKLKYLQQSTHSNCGYFGDLYFENFDGKRMEDFNKQNMLDVHKYHSSKFFYRPFNKVSPADVYKRL